MVSQETKIVFYPGVSHGLVFLLGTYMVCESVRTGDMADYHLQLDILLFARGIDRKDDAYSGGDNCASQARWKQQKYSSCA